MSETLFTQDATSVLFRDRQDAGISVDDDGEVTIEWDRVERVNMSDAVIAERFDSMEFYKLPAVVARPIKQEYQMGDRIATLVKPRAELKEAAWSLENAPWTQTHPDTGMLEDSNDIKGFWRNPRYIDSADSLEADLHIPVDDEESKEFIEDTGDVSVGFYHKLSPSYDGDVGGAVDAVSGVDGFQTDMYFDHVASVSTGRCSAANGCGINGGVGSVETGTVVGAEDADTLITDQSEGETGERSFDQSLSVHTPEFSDTRSAPWNEPSLEDFTDGDTSWDELDSDTKRTIGNHYLVSKTGFPPENFGDFALPVVDSEGNLVLNALQNAKARASQVSGLDGDTLERVESTINRLANENFSDAEFGEDTNTNNTMTEQNNDCGGIDLPTLSVDAVANKHDGVRSALDEKQEKIEELETKLSSAQDEVSVKTERLEELESKVDSYEEEQKAELVSDIVDHTEVFGGEDELMELGLDEVESKHEIVMELTATDKSAAAGASDSADEPTEDVQTYKRSTPW